MTRYFQTRWCILIIGLTLLASACAQVRIAKDEGSTHRSHPGGPVTTVKSRALVAPGHLTACMDWPFAPMQYQNPNGELTGLDMELFKEVAARLNLKPTPRNSNFDTIVAALKSGKCDLIWADQYVTAEREQQLDMVPYWRAKETLIVPQGNPLNIKSRHELCGLAAAGQSGGTEIEILRSLSESCQKAGKEPIRIRQYPKSPEALQALLSGHVDVWMASLLTASAIKKQSQEAPIALLGSFTVTEEGGLVAISFDKGRPQVKDAVVKALNSMVEDGTYKSIFQRYGLTEIMETPGQARAH